MGETGRIVNGIPSLLNAGQFPHIFSQEPRFPFSISYTRLYFLPVEVDKRKYCYGTLW